GKMETHPNFFFVVGGLMLHHHKFDHQGIHSWVSLDGRLKSLSVTFHFWKVLPGGQLASLLLGTRTGHCVCLSLFYLFISPLFFARSWSSKCICHVIFRDPIFMSK